ncbi:hypothetical protein GCM10023223_04290 [Stackebrandtia albiflava]
MVFVHPLGHGSRVWRRQREALAGRYEVITVDLPGHGGTPGPFTLTAAVGALTPHLSRGAHLVAMGDGCLVAVLAALACRDRLPGLVLSSPRIRPSLPPPLYRVAAAITPTPVLRLFAAARNLRSREVREAVDAGLREVGGDIRRQIAVKVAHTDLTPRLRHLTVPTLVLCGERDPAGCRESGVIAGMLPAARRETVPGAGAFPNLEAAAAFDRIVTGFVDGHSRPQRHDP